MDMAEELQAVIDEIQNAKPVPFSTSAMVNRKSLVDRLEDVRMNLPREIRQARGVVADRQGTLAQTREEAEAILRAARSERDLMVSRTEIVTAAGREADRIIDDAKIRAREIRMEAEDYVDAKLANFEIVLQKTLNAVARGRESLRGRLEAGATPAFDPAETGELTAVPRDPRRDPREVRDPRAARDPNQAPGPRRR
jgi:cell division septum initiation protein DivIVA